MTSGTSPMVEARDLQKVYGTNRAVRGISFMVHRGEVVGFLGPNGAGKSTTMKMLTGYLRPSMGEARVGGLSVADNPQAAQERIGYLPESAPLYDDMMVIDFLHYIAKLRGVVGEDLRRRDLRELRTAMDTHLGAPHLHQGAQRGRLGPGLERGVHLAGA